MPDELGFPLHSEIDLRNYLTRCIIFFPDDCPLDPVSIYAPPPSVGDSVSLSSSSRQNIDECHNYSDWYDWKVKRVCLSIMVSSAEDALSRNMNGHPGSAANYEIAVTGGKRYSDIKPNNDLDSKNAGGRSDSPVQNIFTEQ